MAFVFKAIKPGQLRPDAIRMEILNALRAEGREQTKLLQATVETWENPPTFESKIHLARGDGSAAVETYPAGDPEAVKHWNWTDKGTEAHAIAAVNAPALAFQTGFEPKTRNRWFGSGPGRRSGEWRRPFVVWHPGTAAREWSKQLLEDRLQPFTDAIRGAIMRGSMKMWTKGE